MRRTLARFACDDPVRKLSVLYIWHISVAALGQPATVDVVKAINTVHIQMPTNVYIKMK